MADNPTAGSPTADKPAATQPAAPKAAASKAKVYCKYYDKNSKLCMNMYPCEYKGRELQCMSFGDAPTRAPGPAARPKPAPAKKAPGAAKAGAPGKAAAAAKAAPPRKAAAPKVETAADVVTRGTLDECMNGSEGFYYKGVCLGGEHDACRFQTDLRFPVKSSAPIFQNRKFAKCMKYGIVRCPKGDMALYHPQKHVCLATGKAPCSHQVMALQIPLDGHDYAYCDRYEK
jgi:hypothetical protein